LSKANHRGRGKSVNLTEKRGDDDQLFIGTGETHTGTHKGRTKKKGKVGKAEKKDCPKPHI